MANSLRIPQTESMSAQLGALIAHFNISSKSVQRTFAKLLNEVQKQNQKEELKAKVESGVKAIQNGEGISRKEGESTAQFFERLCTE